MFDSPRLIINSHLDILFTFPPLCSSSLNDLKRFFDIFHENIAALRSFDALDKKGFFLYYIASHVFDSATKCLFNHQRNNATLSVIDILLKFVQTQCQVLQNSSVSSILEAPFKTKSPFSLDIFGSKHITAQQTMSALSQPTPLV